MNTRGFTHSCTGEGTSSLATRVPGSDFFLPTLLRVALFAAQDSARARINYYLPTVCEGRTQNTTLTRLDAVLSSASKLMPLRPDCCGSDILLGWRSSAFTKSCDTQAVEADIYSHIYQFMISPVDASARSCRETRILQAGHQ